MKSTTIKQKYRTNLLFVVFRLFLIRNRCTRKLIIKAKAAYVCANEQFFFVFLRFSVLFSVVLIVQLWKLY